MSNSPIGIFDSGIGGTSIWKEIHHLLPHENTLYLADSVNAPYGPKGKARIQELSIKNTELLLKKGCKIIVVACNTATTNAIQYLRKTYNIPFIGIEPAIKPAVLQSHTKSIGILATQGTLSSELFHQTMRTHAKDVKIIEQIGEGLVPLIEAGMIQSSEMDQLLESFLQPMLKAKIDYLVLGCSHYPYLIPKLKTMLPENVTIIDSGAAVARQTKAVLASQNLLNSEETPGMCTFYTNSNPTTLRSIIPDEFLVNVLDF